MIGVLLFTLCAAGSSFLRASTRSTNENSTVANGTLSAVAIQTETEDVHPWHAKDARHTLVNKKSVAKLAADVESADEHAVTRHGKVTLRDIEPIIWIHVPKTGTSFKITLVHSVCPELSVKEMNIVEWKMKEHGNKDIVPVDELCAKQGLEGSYVYGHKAYPDMAYQWPQHKHEVVMFMREPTQRVLSGYFHNLHDCPSIREQRGCLDQDQPCPHLYTKVSNELVTPYAHCVSGCATKMMVGRNCNDIKPVTLEERNIALHRMEFNVAFVGMTEQWDLSICLYHAMFGGQCIHDELRNIRKSPTKNVKHGAEYPDEDLLHNFVDDDQPLYELSKKKFNALLLQYGINKTVCAQRCPGGSF